MEQQTAAGEFPERVAIGLELGMQREHAGVVPRAPALAKGPANGEDGGRDGSPDNFWQTPRPHWRWEQGPTMLNR